jgi:hypothetical protein
MTSFSDRTLAEDVLANGVDDWVYAGWVLQIARRSGLTDPAQLRALALGVTAELIVTGMVVPGDVDDGTHVPWSCSNGESIARITEAWVTWGLEPPSPGAVVWLDVTPAGQEVGEVVLRRELSK